VPVHFSASPQQVSDELMAWICRWRTNFDAQSLATPLTWLPVGGTLMKRRHLELLGYTVVSLSFWILGSRNAAI
jgi:hypothetical protein